MMWQYQLEAMDDEALRDLIGYLYGYEKYADANREKMIHILLTGKKRSVFYLMDKNAFKTLRRLVRHPDRPLTYRYYPVDQLLELSMIEEVPHLENDETRGWYQIRKEAMPFALRVAKNRHYDPLVAQLQKQDELLLGMFHTFGLLELNQCVRMLAEYGIIIESEHLFAAMTWRLRIREQLQAFQIRQNDEAMSFIMLRGMNFMELYRGIMQYPEIPYTLCCEEEMRSRTQRYYAAKKEALKPLENHLLTHFSRRFVRGVVHELIDVYQYHTGSFTYEDMIYRVFAKEEIAPLLEEAIQAIPDQYRKGLSLAELAEVDACLIEY